MVKDINQLIDNIVNIASEGALLTVGTKEKFNTMTIGWMTFGVLWGRRVVTAYIRPTRYTYQFVENEDFFTISFFDDTYHNKLAYLGTHSGRLENKVKKCNLTPRFLKNGISFEEAETIIVCQKIYFQDLDCNLISNDIKTRYYESGDFHRMYFGEIINIHTK